MRTGPSLTAGLPAGSVVVTVLTVVQTLLETQSQDSTGLTTSDGWGLTGGSAGGVRSLADVADAAGTAGGGGGAGDMGDADVQAEDERE